TNDFFGSDPAPGVNKECDVLGAAPALVPVAPTTATPVPLETWTRVAGEYDRFTVAGQQTVRYGSNGGWLTKSASGGVECTNSFFGGDPAYGILKQCEVVSSAVGS